MQPSSDIPTLFDRTALDARRTRIRDDALFLHRIARDEVEDRLDVVNRTFTAPVVVSPVPDLWQDLLPGTRVIADGDVLDLEEQSHDLVIHAMALHWANDPVGQIIQCRRALKPDGLFLSLAFGGRTLHELRTALAQAETQVTGGLSPRVAPMAEIRDMGALLQRAGLALPVADVVPLTADYRDIFHLMQDLRAMGEGNALTDRLRHPTRRSVFAAAQAIYAETHGRPDGRIPATFEIICLTAWAPDASQPQPLRPGSAANRLADALKTDEFKLPD
ncbi:methyltransferase domain-containing protein [Chachezhania antarctica]|uniref:methyltransferase domain-containing protein n=1 Tax=Chachezhania antarctica TaxID=2340860 RepID=UPI000EAD808A|nr:methyltransferase domain-containing protein [Chachezhania antarctica]|tara:strand:+ start:1511 stop:2338 length:828 start_codon:yes stop_codon:yes gene_type:complete